MSIFSNIAQVFLSGSHAERPRFKVDTIFDIDTKFVEENSITGLIFDLDQTVVAQGENQLPQKALVHIQLLANLLDGKVCFLTNEPTKERAQAIQAQTELPVVETKFLKPNKQAFLDALEVLELNASANVAMVGDRLWTDILGGNKAGLTTIRVLPKTPSKDGFAVSLIRPIEEYSASSTKFEAFGLLAGLASITGVSLLSILGFLTRTFSNFESRLVIVEYFDQRWVLFAFVVFCLMFLRIGHVRNRHAVTNNGNTVTSYFNTYPLALRVLVTICLLTWSVLTNAAGTAELGAIYFFCLVTVLSCVASFFKSYHTSHGRLIRVVLDMTMFIFLASYLQGYKSLIPLAFLTIPIATSARYHGVVVTALATIIAFGSLLFFVQTGTVFAACSGCDMTELGQSIYVIYLLAYLFTGILFSLEYSELLRPFSQMAIRFSPRAGDVKNDLEGYMENASVVLGCSDLLFVAETGKGYSYSRTSQNGIQKIEGEDAAEIASFLNENRTFRVTTSDRTQAAIDKHSIQFRRIETALNDPIQGGVKSALVVAVPQMPSMSIVALNCLTRNGVIRSQFSVHHLTVARMIALGFGAALEPFTSKKDFEDS